MRGTIGILVGILIMALGLGGLGVALAQMMTQTDPNAALISVGGLGVFVAVCLFLVVMAHFS